MCENTFKLVENGNNEKISGLIKLSMPNYIMLNKLQDFYTMKFNSMSIMHFMKGKLSVVVLEKIYFIHNLNNAFYAFTLDVCN